MLWQEGKLTSVNAGQKTKAEFPMVVQSEKSTAVKLTQDANAYGLIFPLNVLLEYAPVTVSAYNSASGLPPLGTLTRTSLHRTPELG